MSITNFYLYLKHGFGLTKAFRFAFGITLRDFILNTVFFLATLALMVSALTYTLDSIIEGNQIEAQRQAAYVKSLEKVVADCLSDSTGKPVQIGDELYFCGIVPTGVKL